MPRLCCIKNIFKALFQAPNGAPYLSSRLLPWGEREKAEWITHTSPPCWEPAAVTAHSAQGRVTQPHSGETVRPRNQDRHDGQQNPETPAH